MPALSLVIDTDTASDDAVALLIAATAPNVRVRAVTVVAGNVPLDLAVRNALTTLELVPHGIEVPVYAGLAGPLTRVLETGQFVHGQDGMGDAGIAMSTRGAKPLHAVDLLRRVARDEPGQHTLVTLGPLSNIATALLLDPLFLTRFSHTYMMLGAPDGVGNVNTVGEFNAWADPEACAIVMGAAGDKTMIGWNISRKYAVVDTALRDRLEGAGRLGRFTVSINRTVDEYSRVESGLAGFDLPDPIAMAIAIDPSLATRTTTEHVGVSCDAQTRGQTFVDARHTAPPANCTVVWEASEDGFRRVLLATAAS